MSGYLQALVRRSGLLPAVDRPLSGGVPDPAPETDPAAGDSGFREVEVPPTPLPEASIPSPKPRDSAPVPRSDQVPTPETIDPPLAVADHPQPPEIEPSPERPPAAVAPRVTADLEAAPQSPTPVAPAPIALDPDRETSSAPPESPVPAPTLAEPEGGIPPSPAIRSSSPEGGVVPHPQASAPADTGDDPVARAFHWVMAAPQWRGEASGRTEQPAPVAAAAPGARPLAAASAPELGELERMDAVAPRSRAEPPAAAHRPEPVEVHIGRLRIEVVAPEPAPAAPALAPRRNRGGDLLRRLYLRGI